MCDVAASTLMFIALTLVDASVYQMMRGMIVFITAIFSIIFLKRVLYRHHYTALVFIIGGIGIVGLANILATKKDALSWDAMTWENLAVADSVGLQIIGFVLLIGSQFAAGTMFIVEEKLLGNY
jgi:drug/metabolite transporter (DMT)-like permease